MVLVGAVFLYAALLMLTHIQSGKTSDEEGFIQKLALCCSDLEVQYGDRIMGLRVWRGGAVVMVDDGALMVLVQLSLVVDGGG